MFFLRPASVLLSVLASLALAGAALAADLATLVGNLTSGGLSEREAAITALAASGDERAVPILEALVPGSSIPARPTSSWSSARPMVTSWR